MMQVRLLGWLLPLGSHHRIPGAMTSSYITGVCASVCAPMASMQLGLGSSCLGTVRTGLHM